MSDSSVRIPFAGLENPAWAGWSHGDVPCESKKAPGSSWPGKLGKCTGVAGYAVRSTRGTTPSDAANAGARFNLARPKTASSWGFSVQPILENFGLLTLVAECPLMANSGHF